MEETQDGMHPGLNESALEREPVFIGSPVHNIDSETGS